MPLSQKSFSLDHLQEHLVSSPEMAFALAFWTKIMDAATPMPLITCLAGIKDPRRAKYAHRHVRRLKYER
jgi:hypothetical protein